MQTKLIDLLNKFFPKSTVKRESSHYIPYGTHSIYEEDINEVCKVLKHKKITQGDTVPKFEEAISQKVSAKHAVALNSATSALHLSCLSLGVGEGDSRFGAATRESSRGSEKKVDSRGSGALHRGHK